MARWMTRWLDRVALGLGILTLASCSGGTDPMVATLGEEGADDISTSVTVTDSMGDVGVTESASGSESSAGTAGTDDSTGPDESSGDGTTPGMPGDPCTTDADCEDFCNVPDGARDGVCVEACPDAECPDDFVCVSIETRSGPQDACLPAPDTFCQGCGANAECGDAWDICAPLAGGNYCLVDCSEDPTICPAGFSCGLIGGVDDGAIVMQCVPNNGVCCVDGDGDVYGEGEGCLGTDCDDSNPDVYGSAPELCDGLDNDCDELVDNMPVDCDVASCELGSLGYFETAAEACVDGACGGGGTTLCGLYTCVDGGDQGDACATACDGEDDLKCIPAAHCDASVCLDDVADGQVCDEASDCVSGYCNNGFCCSGGDCCQVASDCPTFGTTDPICTSPATCQGSKGEAVCGANFVCSNTGTEEDDSACDAAVEASDCGPYPAVFCTGDVDQTPPVCATSCSSDAECDADAHCDGGTCQPDLPDGSACGGDGWCLSGACNNGFCCAGGDCCQTASDCPASYSAAPTCGDPANCQGTREDATCVANVCGTAAGIEDDSACDAAVEANTCGVYPSQFCNGSPSQNSPACATSCGSDADCDAAAYCSAGNICIPDEPNGDPCAGASQCVSGYCANGFCCDGGDCCANDSDCGALGSPSACNDPATCQGTRVDATCQASFQCATSTVDDDSGCVGQGADDCGLYPSVSCTADADQSSPTCATSCVTDGDCDANAFCDNGACTSDGAAGDPCVASNECGAGLTCTDGVCCTSACGGTCEACNLAGSAGTCTPVADGADPDSECGAVACGGYYFGWVGDTCYERANAADSTCDGAGACQAAADICPTQGQGAASASCDDQCQDLAPGTCSGTTGPSCDDVAPSPNSQTCGEGVCAVTTEICSAGAPVTCTPDGSAATAEVCDGSDNNCDGNVDEGNPEGGAACVTGLSGVCSPGTETCVAGAITCVQNASPGPEICDGIDNDCDPSTPDGADEPTLGSACDGSDADLCTDGVIACVAGALTCTDDASSSAETCDGVDNDCNPATADGSDEAWLGAACDGTDADLCEEGSLICSSGAQTCSDATGDALELCDGLDNDCNPATADGAGEASLGTACDGADSDLCEDGVLTCSGGALSCTDDATSSAELCDGIDNDCNPATADGSDEAWLGVACDGVDADLCEEGSLICSGGTQACSDATGDAQELCDGVDNDCDPSTADGVDEASLGAACDGTDLDACDEGVLECLGGSLSCSDGSGDSVEVCNGVDDDCNGVIDDGDVCPCQVIRNNGRLYQLCDNNYTTGKNWSESNAACTGAPDTGYRLVTVSDQAENDYLFGLVESYLGSFNQGKAQVDQRYFWIGGTDFCGGCGGNCCEGTWEWTDGTVFYSGGAVQTYANWYVQTDGASGDPVATEPNNAGLVEHTTEFGRFYEVNVVANRSKWNDADGGNLNFYICEYDP